ncbi:MAG: PorT family protein [Hymenobacteraceae bacterium]|nr:PorT family protein [Hymenobacteraceae bacterium]
MMLIRFGRALALILLFLAAITASAQVTGGLKVGGNAAFILRSKTVVGTTEPKPGMVGGLFLSLPLSERVAVQPEVQYSQLGTTFKGSSRFSSSTRRKLYLDEVTVPLLLKVFLVRKKIHLHIGPQIGFIVRANQEGLNSGKATTFDVRSQYRATDYGVVIGAGANLPLRLTFDVRYIAGLADLTVAQIQEDIGVRNQHALQLLLGLRIF